MFSVQDSSTVFTLTDIAAEKVKSLIEAEGNPEPRRSGSRCAPVAAPA